jgi:hypothetical protein
MKKEEIFFSDKSQIGAKQTPIENSHVKFSRGAKVDEIRDIKDIAKALREYVKKKYPNCKFSVSIQRYSGGQSLYVSLQEADFNPLIDESHWSVSKSGNKSFDVNQYHIENSKQLTPQAISVLKDVRNFYNQFNYNHSDPSTDYFNVRFYDTITIGSWDKGFVQVGKKSKTPRTPKPAPEKSGAEPKYSNGTKIIYKTSKGSESGTVKSSKYIASRESFLYQVENPRGGFYNIWESNIVGLIPMPEKPTPETPEPKFKVDEFVIPKGDDDTIYKIFKVEKDANGRFEYGIKTAFSTIAYRKENDLELSEQPKFKKGDIVKYIDDNGKTYKIQFITFSNISSLFIAQLQQIDGTEIVGASEQEIELAEDKTPQPQYSFKVGDVFRRNMEGEVPPNTTIIYTILSIGQDKTQYRIDYLDKGTNRLSSKSNEKLNEEVLDKWWIPYETQKVENSELQQAIDELKESNDALWQLYIDEGSTYDLKQETRIITNDNCVAINEFSADLNFNAEKFLSDYFEKATKPISYDNTELSREEFDKIVNSKAFIDWFGDYKRTIVSDDPALFSKVLTLKEDEKGIQKPTPNIVYHGTWNKSHFSRFKFNKFPIIYFATNKSYAEWFAKIGTGIIYECFLDIKYLCDFRDLGLTPITWNDLSVYLKNTYGIILPENNSQKVQPAWAWIRFDAPQFLLINAIKESGFTGMAHIENNPQDKLPNGEDNTTTAYMIFSPEQAKLVRYVSSCNAFTDIFFMKKGGKISKSALLEKIKSLRV